VINSNSEYIAMHLDRLSEELIYNTYGKRDDEELEKKKRRKSDTIINTAEDDQKKEEV
jgi:hypothetical protein